MARRPRTAPGPTVTWRDGVHLTGTPIWCDARRRRDVCFVSSADRVGRIGHGQLIATPTTIALLGAHEGGNLAVPLRRPFTLGTLRLELIASGRGLGAAALHVEIGARTVLYAGAIRTVGPVEPADVRACDAVVVAAPVADTGQRFEPLDIVAGRVIDWSRAQIATDHRPVLVVDNVLDGLEVAACVAGGGLEVAGSRSLREAAASLGDLAALPAIHAPTRDKVVVVRVERDRIKVGSRSKVVPARVSPDALEPVAGWISFAWPCVADRDQLLAWIEQTRARDVFVTGAGAESIVATLGARGHVLGPPRQMALFES